MSSKQGHFRASVQFHIICNTAAQPSSPSVPHPCCLTDWPGYKKRRLCVTQLLSNIRRSPASSRACLWRRVDHCRQTPFLPTKIHRHIHNTMNICYSIIPRAANKPREKAWSVMVSQGYWPPVTLTCNYLTLIHTLSSTVRILFSHCKMVSATLKPFPVIR